MKYFATAEFKKGIFQLQEHQCIEILDHLRDCLTKIKRKKKVDNKINCHVIRYKENAIELRWRYSKEDDYIALTLSDLIKVEECRTRDKMNDTNEKKIFHMFEIEFCLKRDAYCRIYNEDGSLWDTWHRYHTDLFHESFKTWEGKIKIIDDLKVLFWTYFKDGNNFYNSFCIEEFTEKEKEFLKQEMKYFLSETNFDSE